MLDKESVRRAARYLQQEQSPRQQRERPLYFHGGFAVMEETEAAEVRAALPARRRHRFRNAA